MIAVWESDISAIFLIISLKLLRDTAFFRHLGKLFHNIAPLLVLYSPLPGKQKEISPPPGLLMDYRYVLCTKHRLYDIDFRTIAKPDIVTRT